MYLSNDSNIHETDLDFSIANLFTKLLMSRYCWGVLVPFENFKKATGMTVGIYI